MTDRQKMITEIVMYRNYMKQINHKYEEYAYIKREIDTAEKESDGFWKDFATFVGMGCIVWGGVATLLKCIISFYPERATEIDLTILNFLNPIEWLNVFLIVFGVFYLTFSLIRENRREKPIKEKIVELKKEKVALERELKKHYDEYGNAPLSFQFSDPGVVDIIIDMLEDNEKMTIKQATDKILKKC